MPEHQRPVMRTGDLLSASAPLLDCQLLQGSAVWPPGSREAPAGVGWPEANLPRMEMNRYHMAKFNGHLVMSMILAKIII